MANLVRLGILAELLDIDSGVAGPRHLVDVVTALDTGFTKVVVTHLLELSELDWLPAEDAGFNLRDAGHTHNSITIDTAINRAYSSQ